MIDLGARIQNLRVTEAALQGIMAKATKISDILEVQGQLTNVQGQIEELTTEQTHLQQQAADGTLTVGFEAPVVAVTTATNDWNLGEQVDKAAAQLLQVGQGVATGLVWLGIVGLPFLLVLLIFVGLPLMVLRRRLGRRPGGGPLTPTSDAARRLDATEANRKSPVAMTGLFALCVAAEPPLISRRRERRTRSAAAGRTRTSGCAWRGAAAP